MQNSDELFYLQNLTLRHLDLSSNPFIYQTDFLKKMCGVCKTLQRIVFETNFNEFSLLQKIRKSEFKFVKFELKRSFDDVYTENSILKPKLKKEKVKFDAEKEKFTHFLFQINFILNKTEFELGTE